MAGSDWKEYELSSGVTVLYGPFAHGLYFDIMGRALDDHPDPDVPQKEIEVLGGTEEVDDLEDPEYVRALGAARLARYNLLGEAALDLCMEVKGGMGPWEDTIDRIADKYAVDPPPDDPDGRKVWFLSKYAMRTAEDWKLVGKIQRFSQIDDEEVRQRAEQFPGDVEGPAGDGADAPGPSEE